MRWEDLIPACCELIQTYNPVLFSPDTFFQQTYGKHEDKNEAAFLQQVFYGCNRYRAFLNTLNKAIFRVYPTTTNHNDLLPFSVVAYLALFRLDELGIKSFRRLVETQEPLKMHTLLSFLFNPEILRREIREEWCALYDYKFVDNEVIGKVEQRLSDLRDLLSRLETIVSGPRVEETKADPTQTVVSKKTTVPVPFQLTKPKPRKLLKPIEIPHIRAKPVDPRIYETSYDVVVQRQEQRLKASLSQTRSKYDHEHDPIKRLFAS